MTEADRTEFLACLARDVERTLGSEHVARIAHHVEMFDALDRDDFAAKVACDVQQEVMDTHVHVTWPPCPVHPQHPLWFEAGAWRCEVDPRVSIALGELRPVAS
jgi:hypothetical protein